MVQWDASLLFPSCKCGRGLDLLRRRGLFLYEVLGDYRRGGFSVTHMCPWTVKSKLWRR